MRVHDHAEVSAPTPKSQMKSSPSRPRSDQVLAVGVLLVCSLYRPLIFWADNAWNLSSPFKALTIGLVAFGIGLILWWLLTKLGIQSIPAALGVGGLILILFHWQRIDVIHPLLWVALAAIVMWATHKRVSKKSLEVMAILVVAAVGVSSVAQLVAEHIRQTQAYPLAPLAEHVLAATTGEVEDLVLFVVDSYPDPVIGETWFGHDAGPLHSSLTDSGFVVQAAAFSQHTFTSLAIPSMLELQPVTGEDPTAPWSGNRARQREIIGGDSFTRRALESAGFRYTHVEGGVDVSSCGGDVDVCVNSTWMDEASWKMLQTSVLGPYLLERNGSWALSASVQATDNLTKVLEEVQGNGVHDFVFGHIILPHPPTIADAECQRLTDLPSTEVEQIGIEADSRPDHRFNGQLACADRLISQVAAVIEPSTAVVITADHGTAFSGQVRIPVDTWTDSDIVERFGILLAYSMPGECPDPVDTTNIDVMRAVLECTINLDMPARQTRFLIGAIDPVWVDPSRMALIRERLETGDFPRPDEPDTE